MDFNKVIEKYNYNKELGDLLYKIYQEQIKIFGTDCEELIYNAYMETKVVEGNPYEVLVASGMYEERNNALVTSGDLKRASGVSSNKPIIVFEDNSFKVKKIKRLVVISKFDFNEEYIVGVLVHELSHMIKETVKGVNIDEDKLVIKSGFNTQVYELKNENGKVIDSKIQDKGVGLEEGFNCILEEDIMHSLGYKDYKVSGYGVVHNIAKGFYNIDDLRDLILKAEFWKSDEELNEAFTYDGRNLWEEISLVVDKIYVLGLEMFASMFDQEKMKMVSKQQLEVIEQQYNPLIEELKRFRNEEEECKKII